MQWHKDLLLRYLLIILLICMFRPYAPSVPDAQDVRGVRGVRGQHGGGGGITGWHRDNQCKYEMMHVLKTFIKANKLNQNTDSNWSLYLPCGYNRAETELGRIKGTDPEQKIFIIKGHDNLSRKDYLWSSLRKKYGNRAKDLMPETYVLSDQVDVQRLLKRGPGVVYIMKKNIQRQQGIKMTRNIDDILRGREEGYVIAQEMLQDPYLVDGRKTNCRVYLLVVCKGGVKTGYLYNNGFMYYTPKPFVKNSTEPDRVITAGLSTSRKDSVFYQTHPLTMQEWQRTAGVDLFNRVGTLLNKVLTATSPTFCNTDHLKQQTTFQLFGCDIAFNDKLVPQLIEINKGPDLSGKSEQEITLKNDLTACIFKQVGVPVHQSTHGKLLPIFTQFKWVTNVFFEV